MWRTTRQVLKEYWLAFVVGLAWSGYVGGLTAKLAVYISNFAGAFFLTSWTLGQVNRIRRDQATKDALTTLNRAIADLDASMASLDVSLQTISRWTNGKAYVPTIQEASLASTAVSEAVRDIPVEIETESDTKTGNVVDFNKYRQECLRCELNIRYALPRSERFEFRRQIRDLLLAS
jgi:hypothetical protein